MKKIDTNQSSLEFSEENILENEAIKVQNYLKDISQIEKPSNLVVFGKPNHD